MRYDHRIERVCVDFALHHRVRQGSIRCRAQPFVSRSGVQPAGSRQPGRRITRPPCAETCGSGSKGCTGPGTSIVRGERSRHAAARSAPSQGTLHAFNRVTSIPVDDRSAAERLTQRHEQLLACPHACRSLWPGKDERADTHGDPIRGLGDAGDARPLGRARIYLDADRPIVDEAISLDGLRPVEPVTDQDQPDEDRENEPESPRLQTLHLNPPNLFDGDPPLIRTRLPLGSRPVPLRSRPRRQLEHRQGKEMVEMGESRTPRPETFAGDHYERVR
jgi:hypothetical protein